MPSVRKPVGKVVDQKKFMINDCRNLIFDLKK